MKNLYLLFFFTFLNALCFGQYWQQKVDFKTEVSLDVKEHSLDAFEKITYINNSPDTLSFIWFHLWPNAFKNDQSALSEQLLQNGNTDFYFSNKKERGYVNHLDFKINGVTAKLEDHPVYSDITKLLLPTPLLPLQQITITTPFHVQLPALFSHSGYKNGMYQLTHWYPKPAVYDALGWHPMPLLSQGDFYSEFGDYEVRINLPKDFTVAATGEMQDVEERKRLQNILLQNKKSNIKKVVKPGVVKSKKISQKSSEEEEQKTILFSQKGVHDFAFFVSKEFVVQSDTCQLPSGKIIDVSVFTRSQNSGKWEEALSNAKDAIRTRSLWIGDYPYSTLKVVEGAHKTVSGMEYPTIAVVSGIKDKQLLDEAIAHEIGHNWFYGAVATNERDHPWMDEGINSFYDLRYHRYKYGKKGSLKWGKHSIDFKSAGNILLQTLAKENKDQPIETPSSEFSLLNYFAIGYYKTAAWLSILQDSLGQKVFDKAMQDYYQKWSFKHPYPKDFKAVFDNLNDPQVTSYFNLLSTVGSLPQLPQKKFEIASPLVLKSIENYIEQPSKNLLLLSPMVGYNQYDKLMLGLIATNYKLPLNKASFLLAPLYSTASKKLNGIAKMDFHWHPKSRFQKASAGIAAARFSMRDGRDSLGKKVYESFYKIVPSAALTWKEPYRSTMEKRLEWKTFLIGEKVFNKFVIKSTDSLFYIDSLILKKRFLNSLTFRLHNYRALYPFDYSLQLQQGKEFYRVNFTGHYFFNYASGGGLAIRAFAAKFGYYNERNNLNSNRYLPKLLGVTGEEDYTYSNYFLGRTASYANAIGASGNNAGIGAQQIMIRDGGFKLRADQFDFLQGLSENWVAALNLNTTLPQHLFPIPIPLKLFLDVGTIAEAWDKKEEGNRLKYVAGVQLSLLKNTIHIYAPLLYSPAFRDNLKTFPQLNTFSKRLTFSIDVDQINLRKIVGQELPF